MEESGGGGQSCQEGAASRWMGRELQMMEEEGIGNEGGIPNFGQANTYSFCYLQSAQFLFESN